MNYEFFDTLKNFEYLLELFERLHFDLDGEVFFLAQRYSTTRKNYNKIKRFKHHL